MIEDPFLFCSLDQSADQSAYQFINWLDWTVQCFTSPPTQYRLYGRRISL